jgi:uncharacterized protein YcbK (DUF882 family)/peptidoglycan hydrolase-like protein with peptidoglycan-binding domain
MGLQGLDRATAPSAATARKMLDAIGGRWWNVYIGGPESGGHGWSRAVLEDYARHGIERFMLTYVGRQWNGPLSRAQGDADAADALKCARRFGYTGAFPICLDVELRTFESAPAKTVEYARAWCAAVRAEGARPGVYANPVTFKAMAKGNVPADFAWVASWVGHGPSPRDPHRITSIPDDLWSGPGQRAWQYAGQFGGKPCRVLGLDVDINVADPGCLAFAPGRNAPATSGSSGSGSLRRGDRGPAVERLTRRLTYLRYLDGARGTFDRATQSAVARFQQDHGLEPSGRYGPRTTRKLKSVVAAERVRRRHATTSSPGVGRLPRLVDRAVTADQREDAAVEQLIAYALKRRRVLERARADIANSTPALLKEVVEILERIEDDIDGFATPADEAKSSLGAGAPTAETVVAEPAVASPPEVAKEPPEAIVEQMAPLPSPAAEGPVAPDSAPAPATVALGSMTERAIASVIRRHDEAGDAARTALVERIEGIDADIARLRPGRGGGRRGSGGKGGGGGKNPPLTPSKVPVATKPVKPGRGGRAPGDIRLGDEGRIVRASKIAVARFLQEKGNQEHAPLRRKLRLEARGRKHGGTATRTWERGVRAVQHILGRPATGVMDASLQGRLQRYWPTDSAIRRLLRSGPTWRLIKGQVSPNFNLREFACKDGTAYIDGLMREQGLSKEQAMRRARDLATRLERVRKAAGGRRLHLNSVYRTRAHNAATPNSASNSPHLRGFAADMAHPAGITLAQHRANVRAAFEDGVGFYPNGDFVHGDFDHGLGRRQWVGP